MRHLSQANPVRQDFLVIDTEGNKELSEIAIFDHRGKLIYEAFTQGHPNNTHIRQNLKTLQEIATNVTVLAGGIGQMAPKPLVCHYAKHDAGVLKYSFQKAGIPWQHFTFICTCDLSRQHFPNLAGYGLDYLSKSLNLKVKGKRFNCAQAHTARYDAEFTYHLYNKIVENQQREVTRADLRQTSNPFSSNRVDTPFQDHVDLSEVYQNEFEFLKSILKDVKADRNQQSKAAVVIGEAGTGKTHLMMRLAKETLRTNRLLFIRQPNNADAVLYHVYARILESLAEKVLGGDRTQLELLISYSTFNLQVAYFLYSSLFAAT